MPLVAPVMTATFQHLVQTAMLTVPVEAEFNGVPVRFEGACGIGRGSCSRQRWSFIDLPRAGVPQSGAGPANQETQPARR